MINNCLIFCLVFVAVSSYLQPEREIYESAGSGYNFIETMVEKKIYEALEDFRKTLKEDSDPLAIDYKYFDGSAIGLSDSYLSIKDTKIRNLSTFQVTNLKAKLKYILPLIFQFDFDIGIPTLNVTTDLYDLNATIESISINGNGPASFLLIMPQLMGRFDGQVTLIGSKFGFVVLDADVKLLLKQFKSNISGMYNDEVISEMINEILEDVVPFLIKFYEKNISEILNVLIPKLINGK